MINYSFETLKISLGQRTSDWDRESAFGTENQRLWQKTRGSLKKCNHRDRKLVFEQRTSVWTENQREFPMTSHHDVSSVKSQIFPRSHIYQFRDILDHV